MISNVFHLVVCNDLSFISNDRKNSYARSMGQAKSDEFDETNKQTQKKVMIFREMAQSNIKYPRIKKKAFILRKECGKKVLGIFVS